MFGMSFQLFARFEIMLCNLLACVRACVRVYKCLCYSEWVHIWCNCDFGMLYFFIYFKVPFVYICLYLRTINIIYQLLSCLRNGNNYHTGNTRKQIVVRPHLEYGNTAWCPIFKKDCELLENAKRRATKLTPTLRDLSYVERIAALYLPSL